MSVHNGFTAQGFFYLIPFAWMAKVAGSLTREGRQRLAVFQVLCPKKEGYNLQSSLLCPA